MKTGPEPTDVLEFQFKELSNLKLSNGFDSVPAACSLVAIDGRRGLIYAACDNKLTVLKSGDSTDKDWKREHILPSKVTRLALNCDCSFVAITLLHPTAYIYSAASFAQQNLALLREIKLSSAENVHVLDLRWNPCIPGALCTITSDYTVGSFNVTADKTSAVLTILEKLEKFEVLCVAWSPKGKQLVVGCKNGNLLQLKPDLKVARSIAGPDPNIGSVIAILWISNYQFCAAYLDSNDSRINVIIVDAPKGEANATFTSYEDITYGSPGVEGEEGGPRYYFEHVSEWGLIVAASSSSSEVAVLGSRDRGTTWEQWQLVDSGRAQLPLVQTSESYPVGLAVDRTSINKLPWGGEDLTLPHPVPILHILGTSGQLCSFHMVNLMPGIPGVCSPPTEIVPPSNQPRISLAPTEISFNLIGGVTSTPQPKQVDTSQDRSKGTPPVNLFRDTFRVPVPQPQVELNVPKPQVEIVEPLPKVETQVVPNKEANQQERVIIASDICIRAYQEEWSLFEKEMKSHREVQAVDIGSANERSQLIEKSEKMDRFLMDLQETTVSLTGDISYLKALLLQSFAWLEETKSKSSESSITAQSHGDNDTLKELQNQMYYVQSQLEQAMRALDLEWLEHINKEKSKMTIPRLELVYQNMLQHSRIITKQKNNIQTLLKKWKTLTRGDITSSLNQSMANMSLFSLRPPRIDNPNEIIEHRCKTIASRSFSFSREKQNRLRNLLSRSATKVVKTATPSTIQDRLMETLSSLSTVSPPKQVQEQKTKSKFAPKPEQASKVTATPPVQSARSPLASLDRIVADIGSAPAQPNINAQNRTSTLNIVPVTSPMIKIPQVDSKARVAAAALTPQASISVQPRQNKPISVLSFGTPHISKPASAIPSTMKPVSVPEASPFTSTTSRTSVPSTSPAGMVPPTVTVPSASKPFAKIDTLLFNSGPVKTDVPTSLPISTGISSPISSPTITATVVPNPQLQTNPQTGFSFSSPTQSPISQLPSYPTTPKTTPTVITTTPTSSKTSPLQSFSFASKPAATTPFSFASKPMTSPLSGATQSLDLSAMGLNLQSSSNTPVENLTPTTTVANNSFFGTGGIPSSGSLFGGASGTAKDKTSGTFFGNSGFSSIFSGSTASGSTTSTFGGGASGATPSMKPPIFGAGTSSPQSSIFGGSAGNPATSVTGEIPATSSVTLGFDSSANSQSASVFGNISSTANSPSIFGGSSAPTLNKSVLGGVAASPTQIFGESAASPLKPPTFASESITSSTTGFGRPPDSKPSVFGSIPTNCATLPPFGSAPTGPSSPSIFGGTLSNSPTASTFGGVTSNPSTGSIFGSVLPTSPNQSIFGGAASNASPTTNLGASSPIQTATAPAFGQAATFGAKPEFGSIFGASKPVFGGGGFAGSTFPSPTQPTSGFGGFNTAPMGGNISGIGGGSMQKVFGESSGSSTFENLAAQDGGLTFGNLAQKQAEPAPPSAFTEKSSFQSWR